MMKRPPRLDALEAAYAKLEEAVRLLTEAGEETLAEEADEIAEAVDLQTAD